MNTDLMEDDLVEGPANTAGREGYIIRKALIYAIAYLQNLPKDVVENPDSAEMIEVREMCALARDGDEGVREYLLREVGLTTGLSIDLWPDDPQFIGSGSDPDQGTEPTADELLERSLRRRAKKLGYRLCKEPHRSFYRHYYGLHYHLLKGGTVVLGSTTRPYDATLAEVEAFIVSEEKRAGTS